MLPVSSALIAWFSGLVRHSSAWTEKSFSSENSLTPMPIPPYGGRDSSPSTVSG